MNAATTAGETGSLPTFLTSFVGRRHELSEVRKRLAGSRLVTLTGVGGVGKTRLATEAATTLRRAFDVVAMVDLATVTEGAQVAQAVLAALRLADRSSVPPVDRVVEHVGRTRVLVVLDNCEHVAEGCGAFVDALLRRTERVRVLATSRRTLGVAGEHLYPVPPLRVPDPDHVPGVDALAQYDAVRLLIERAAALEPAFAVTEQNREAAAQLCARLDGLPLAIELAAARLRTLSPQQLLDRLADRFAVLGTGSSTAPPRQQTLRGLVDWSYSLCSPEERTLWARLAVFTGGFDLDAAEAVCGGDAFPGDQVLPVLDRLVAQSIVTVEPAVAEVRFRLLETIREYGAERLTADGVDPELRRRHREFFLQRAQSIAAAWCGPAQVDGLARLRADHGNLRAAFEDAMTDPASAGPALRLTVALRHHWYVDGFLTEGRDWLDAALHRPGQVPQARVAALWVAAWVCLLQGDRDAAGARLDECDRLAGQLGDRSAAGFAASLRGTAALFAGDLPRAISHFEVAVASFREIGDTEGLLWTTFQLAISHSHAGEHERARSVAREALGECERLDERLCRSYTLWTLAFDDWRRADHERARTQARQALSLQREFDDPVGVALMTETLAWATASLGEPRAAARILVAAQTLWQQAGTSLAAFGPIVAEHHARYEGLLERELRAARTSAVVSAARGRAVARVIDLALGTTPAPGHKEDPVLTNREREVAELVAQGLSNRAIASALVISKRTVDGHVERILAKLGFTSRAQVAAWVARQGRPALNRYDGG